MSKTPAAQLTREIEDALANTPSPGSGSGRKQPLYGHTSEATAYVVADYPYGFRERTQIRYWLESKPGKGYRFMAQTMNPKTGRWNKPKASTYVDFAAAMYLDDKAHVEWDGIGAYSDERKILDFVRTFPGADLRAIKAFVPKKIQYLQGVANGQIVWRINGVKQPTSEEDVARTRREIAVWEEIAAAVARAA
jgi:hypothetical protein